MSDLKNKKYVFYMKYVCPLLKRLPQTGWRDPENFTEKIIYKITRIANKIFDI